MANRTKVLETLDQYFKTKKGRILTSQEYARETDTPIRLQQVRNIFGSWNRMEKLLMAKESREDLGAITDVNEIIAARNLAANEARDQWKKASENQDKKAVREATAQVVAEKLAANAATPEGANANKIAIGGPLPSEQPDYDKMGATVNTDPVTKEQTVVDPEPEIVSVVTDDPRTPSELRDAVAAGRKVDTGAPKVGHATDGGSQGEASLATVQALGDVDGTEDDVKTTPVVEVNKSDKTKKS